MGLLALGTPLPWSEAKQHADYVREHGIEQLLHIWHRLKDRTGDRLLWGDEIEYLVISACIPVFHPEYGRYMLESTPGAPYGATLDDLLLVEGNMRFRRKLAKSRMKSHEVPLTLTSFPRLGATGVFTDPYYPPGGGVARSLFLPDEVTNQHVRFPTLTANIRRRRGSKVAINMPIYFDENTPRPFVDPTVPRDRNLWPEDANAREGAALDDHIYMDAMGFGMGCCCLQITFQACSVGEARRMYDAFVPVGPVMLALSAAAPIFRGWLSDVDCRWDVIAGSVDDRTPEERGKEPLQHDRFVIPKSRYDSVDCYIADSPSNRPEYNDNDMPIDPKIRDHLVERGMDKTLATHFAHLFIRDPIVIFEETLCQDDEKSSDHFENIQSTNWQTVRFKPPPPGSPIGWRVEFRSMEVQLTDYENAAFSVFIVLLTRAIMSLGLNFYLPISKVDENMHRAHRRDAINTQKFYFRKNVFDPKPGHPCDPSLDALNSLPKEVSPREPRSPVANGNGSRVRETSQCESTCSSHRPSRSPSPDGTAPSPAGPVEHEYDLFTINEIFNGAPERDFPGLIGVVRIYLDGLEKEGKVSAEVRQGMERSLDLIRRRADGSLITLATYMRRFVHAHPAYKHDSAVTQEINYDLIKALDEIERGERPAPELLPEGWRESYDSKDGRWSRCCGAEEAKLDRQSEAATETAGLAKGAAVVEDKGLCCGPMMPAATA
ncbi:hypothetical protein JCM8202_005224 [Rhodotorula sphaerocarpa]